MSEKIVLIDGHSIINRAFYGVPDLTNSDGLHTNAIYGFLNIMFRILDEEKPDYLVVAFDLKAPTFRHQMYDAYKGTRKPMPEELREQVPVLKEVLQAMGIPLLMKEGFEADDLLGTAARVSEEKGINAVIVSGDRDLLQLATDNVLIRMPKTKRGTTEIENYYAADVKEAYQVNPPQIIELKALMGDASDNIPGVPGIGEKTATNLIVAYGSIENAYAHVEEIKPNRAKEALRNHYDMAKMSKKLATICVQAPLELSWENAKLTNLYTPEVYEWFKKLNFKKLLSRFDLTGTELPSVPEVKRVTELGEAESIFAKAAGQDRLAFEICQSKDEFGISLALSEQEVYYLAAEGFLTEEYLTDHMTQVVEQVPLCAASDVKKLLKMVHPVHREHFFDIEIAAYLINPLISSYAHEDMGTPHAALTTLKKLPELLNKLDEMEMRSLFDEVEMPLVFTLFDMEQEGMRVNAEELKAYGEALVDKISALEKSIHEAAGEEFNINSPKQLGVIPVSYTHLEWNTLRVFAGSALFCIVSGALLRGKKPENTTIFSVEGYVSVALCWVALSICGAIPLCVSGVLQNPFDAFFEIVSGFTTTGSSVMQSVEGAPRAILMWRSFSHWVGGMGVLVFMLALLPMAGPSSMHLMKAESPGPSVGKLVPKVRSTAKILYQIYFVLTVVMLACMILTGCPLFDSINLTFATAGIVSGCAIRTGGRRRGRRMDSWNRFAHQVHFALFISLLIAPIAAKHG